MSEYGPQIPVCDDIHSKKYRLTNESFEEAKSREAAAMADDDEHRRAYKKIILPMRFMAAGRVQSAMGSPRDVTALNCFVCKTIEDSLASIMQSADYAAETMRRGGGIGYDFSRIRPNGDRIVSLDSYASGPVSFMQIHDAVCHTILSAGLRRGAMMAVLRVDHPDIEEFIRAKMNDNQLTNFNISVGVTDEFMEAVVKGTDFELKFEGVVHRKIDARMLWDEIMRNNWDWAEPGVLFLDRINEENNLSYCETIEATNPCGEQPLPPNGACLLGSYNLVQYTYLTEARDGYVFNWDLFKEDIPHVVRAMDNVIDNTSYPLREQELEQKRKRRIGLGITGLSNTLTMLGIRYGSSEALRFIRRIMKTLRDGCYNASADLAAEKGAFPFFKLNYLDSPFIQRLPEEIQEKIKKNGIRNSHLISIAPTGTISFTADNISSGIEPVFAVEVDRTILSEDGPIVIRVQDYVYQKYGLVGEASHNLTIDEHLDTQIAVQPFVDSAVSKTINVGDEVTFDEFKDIYIKGWRGGLKGVTTFRSAGKRYGILNTVEAQKGAACFINPTTGSKECD
jgi:ribonucleoside-diphosphate reductase alpha chain